MLRCDVDIPIFPLQWVSALEPQALTFTLKDHKMATFTVPYTRQVRRPNYYVKKNERDRGGGWGKRSPRTLVNTEQMLKL